jgi:hypothetical protein
VAEVARNASCPCGSGQKFKRCCMGKAEAKSNSLKIPAIILAVGFLAAAVLWIVKGLDWAGITAGGALIAAIVSTQLGGAPPPKENVGSADSINFGG